MLLRQLLAFGATGVVNTAVGLAVIIGLMMAFDVTPWIANAGGYAVGLTVSFVLNRFWTFRDTATGMPILAFLFAVAVSFVVNLGVLTAALAIWPEHRVVAQILAVASYSCVFFIACRLVVFNERAKPVRQPR